jgi:glycosyl transferase family 2
MPAPLVSIVVNNFNYARFLPHSIESALAQTHPRVEVVVVDDASTDGSQDVIRGYGDRLVPVLQERNGGQGAAFNAGFAASHGDLVIYLDADDWLYPQAAERVAAALRLGVAKVHYRLDLVNGRGEKIDVYPPPEVTFDSGDVVPTLLACGRYETTVTSGNAFARWALAAMLPVPPDDFRISADGYLVTLAPLFGTIVSIEEPLGAYCQHGGGAWAPSTNKLGEGFRRAVQHDAHRHHHLQERAHALGLAMRPRPGLRDHAHLASRLASLCTDPARHPHPADTRIGLALRGAWASRNARLPLKRRALLAAWFLAAGALPRPLARAAVAWKLVPSSRPPRVDRAFKAVRRVLR